MHTIHEVKSWPLLFREIVSERKTHELRINDRNYKVGDILHLKEFDPETGKYSGRDAKAKITYINSREKSCAASTIALHPEYCILSVKLIESRT
jgi:hypothetical protein